MPDLEVLVNPNTAMPPETLDALFLDDELFQQSHDTAAAVDTTGYEYTRQDGTVERAANAAEAIKLCPVLGELALKDPESADLLLELSSLGQAKMNEQANNAAPQERASIKQPHKSDKVLSPQNSSEHQLAEAFSQEPTVRQTVKPVLPEVKDHIKQALIMQHQEVERIYMSATEPKPEPAKISKEKPGNAVVITVENHSVARDTEKIRHQTSVKKVTLAERPEKLPIYKATAKENDIHQEVKIPKHTEAAKPVDHKRQEFIEQYAYKESEIAIAVEAIFEAPVMSLLDDYHEDKVEPPDVSAIPGVVTPLAFEHEEPTITHIPEFLAWEDPLEEKPLEIFDDFTEALHRLFETETLLVISEEQTDLIELPPKDELPNVDVLPVPEAEVAPTIVEIVAQRLDECAADEKEEIAPMLQDIVDTIEVLEMLEAEPITEPEVTESVSAQLEEQIIILFEQLGIEYKAEDIEKFMLVLIKSDFKPQQREITENETVDIEHDGTHEAKRHFAQQFSCGHAVASDWSDRQLGRIILMHDTSARQKQFISN